jgi:hypothetical protein
MGNNIVIFSDGTGQRSGLFLDENRSNIYKLYRATRCGPDTEVDPAEQLTFYDPGIGTSPISENFFLRLYRRVYNVVSQATGLGLTGNVIDCYAAIIRMWEPGDRIFLFGFSRGAYTVRCLGGVLTFCGVPTQMPDGGPVLRDQKTSKTIAREAVMNVYQHTASVHPEKASLREKALLEQRTLLATRFRKKYGSGDETGPTEAPYFIGVFDTVASLANPVVVFALGVVGLLLIVGLSYLLSIWSLSWLLWMAILGVSAVLFFGSWYVRTHFKMPGALPGFSPWQTFTRTEMLMNFYDNRLSQRVKYARHAVSIDEDRKTFQRVGWGTKGVANEPDENGVNWFEQKWFAGNHSDVGGSYSENDARLSDISLKWMLDAAASTGLKFDSRYMRLYPDPTGPQHDERRSWVFRFAGVKLREIVPNATLHESVARRFEASAVLHYDLMKPYRPVSLRGHEQVRHWYT